MRSTVHNQSTFLFTVITFAFVDAEKNSEKLGEYVKNLRQCD